MLVVLTANALPATENGTYECNETVCETKINCSDYGLVETNRRRCENEEGYVYTCCLMPTSLSPS